MHIGLPWCVTLFNVSSFLLIAEHSANFFWCWHLHTQELLPYHNIKLVQESSAENHEVWMVYVDHIESECFGSGIELTVDFGTPSYEFVINICTYLIF
jgi:hypothetical protein